MTSSAKWLRKYGGLVRGISSKLRIRYFLVEPHFLFPFFQFLPLSFRAFLVSRYDIGHYRRISDKLEAEETVKSIRLLTERELRELFPGGRIYREKILGLTKSFVVYDGWE